MDGRRGGTGRDPPGEGIYPRSYTHPVAALSAYEALETATQTGIEFARSTARWFGVGAVANVGGHPGVARPLVTLRYPRNVSHQLSQLYKLLLTRFWL